MINVYFHIAPLNGPHCYYSSDHACQDSRSHAKTHGLPKVMNLFEKNLKRQRRTFPDVVRPEQGLVFADVDPCRSELEDILESAG
jgi:hypothetical protein